MRGSHFLTRLVICPCTVDYRALQRLLERRIYRVQFDCKLQQLQLHLAMWRSGFQRRQVNLHLSTYRDNFEAIISRQPLISFTIEHTHGRDKHASVASITVYTISSNVNIDMIYQGFVPRTSCVFVSELFFYIAPIMKRERMILCRYRRFTAIVRYSKRHYLVPLIAYLNL